MRETGFEMALLKQLDAEILIGQLSYKQWSEIYNVKHGYDKAKKKVPRDEKTPSQARYIKISYVV